MTTPVRISGSFDVRLDACPADPGFEDLPIGRRTIDKRFHGELDAASRGQMLAFRSAVQGSAGYVAMERVEGTLCGRRGSFVLQHSGTMQGGGQSLALSVVPDSGDGELAGLAGDMAIRIEEGGRHFYDFTFTLPAAR